MERLGDILDRRWLTNRGPYVQEFEARVAAVAGVQHCVAVCNGTIALEVGVRGLGLTGEVIVPAFTFIATAHALEWQGITPVFADIDPCTHLLDVASVRRAITPRTTGIVGVHVWGQVSEVEQLQELADEYGLRLLFDAAHAFGCAKGTRPAGSFGDLEVFSFHATKFVNSLEGGAIVTNNDELAQKLRLMTNFGFLGYDNVGYIGTNGKMNEFSAAMGLTTIESMNDFVAVNRRNEARYREELAGLPGVRVMTYRGGQTLNAQYVIVEVDSASSPISRDRLLDVLWAENILARRYFYPGCHRMEPYRSRRGAASVLLPETDRVAARVLVLPTGQAMSTDDIGVVCQIIRLAVMHGGELMTLDPSGAAVHSGTR